MKYHEKVEEIYQRILPYIKKTPLLSSPYFSKVTASQLFYKCENLQFTHSFKVRGVFSKVTTLKEKNKILIASSGGNHGLAVAYAAKVFNMKAVIVVPDFVPQFRIDKIKSLDAQVIVHGKTMDEMNAKIAELTVDSRYEVIHPFSDDDVILGQGTVALEILSMLPDVQVMVVSIGGGGLISGIAQYAKSVNPNILIYGVQTVGADAMFKSLQADRIVAIPSITSIAISLGATKVTEKTFDLVKKYVDKVITVTDDETIRDLKMILEQDKLFVEPASSCCLSAVLSKQLPSIEGKKAALVLCGGNFSLQQLKGYL